MLGVNTQPRPVIVKLFTLQDGSVTLTVQSVLHESNTKCQRRFQHDAAAHQKQCLGEKRVIVLGLCLLQKGSIKYLHWSHTGVHITSVAEDPEQANTELPASHSHCLFVLFFLYIKLFTMTSFFQCCKSTKS